MLSVLPPYTGTSKVGTTTATSTQSSTIQVTSTLSLLSVQTLNPQTFEGSETSAKPSSIRLLSSSQGKTPAYFLSTPVDRAAAATEGSRLWKLCMEPWGEQIDELVRNGSYLPALALLESIDETLLPDKVFLFRTIHQMALKFSQYTVGKTKEAYPSIARRLDVRRRKT